MFTNGNTHLLFRGWVLFFIYKKMRYLLFFCCICLAACTVAKKDVMTPVTDDYRNEIQAHQAHLNEEYKDSTKSPLKEEDRLQFEGLEFFDINPTFRVEATFKKATSDVFKMKTTTERAPEYRKYGTLTFKLQGKRFRLTLYQNLRLMKMPQYKDYLFLPFTDPTNGEESYGGGRYIDFKIPEGEAVILDFNKAYNPYCAYNSKYSCPIPPVENDLSVPINAGVKAWDKH